MRCACNRWGPGTTSEKPINTQAAKELEDRLAKLKAERAKTDTMWDAEVDTSEQSHLTKDQKKQRQEMKKNQ